MIIQNVAKRFIMLIWENIMRQFFSKHAGFTLVELMFVIAIIGILATVAIPAYFNHVLRIRQSVGTQNLLDIKVAQEKYYALFDTYANPLILTDADTPFVNYVNFDTADAMYQYTITGNANTFTATLNADLDGDAIRTDCWSITDSTQKPLQDTTTDPCSDKDEGFSFSLIKNIF